VATRKSHGCAGAAHGSFRATLRAGNRKVTGMRSKCFLILSGLVLAALVRAQTLEAIPADPYFANFKPVKAPQPAGLVLQKGDRLAICGDSITEQRMYSQIMETYLTVCVPELEIAVRQYGWGGETAPGFFGRQASDCLRFKPTIATTCYGMNDHGYGPYRQEIGDRYREFSRKIVQAFKAAGARVIQGSPGCVSHKDEALNLNLCTLRAIGIEIAQAENVGFADVFWPMFTAEFAAHKKYAPNYWIAGGDGVHPGWSGHLVMAYAFLKSFGLSGDVGTFTVDLKANKAEVSTGHELVAFGGGELKVTSRRYPFCATGPVNQDNSVRSGMTLVPFNQELNRMTLVVKNGEAQSYKITWGAESKTYSAEALAKGVNLAEDFAVNPFSDAFRKVEEAVAAKQGYETHQIKAMFHGPEFQLAPDEIVAVTEKVRTPLAENIKKAFVPVTHTITITPQ
jgi:lysophospholipase L1-like esterase